VRRLRRVAQEAPLFEKEMHNPRFTSYPIQGERIRAPTFDSAARGMFTMGRL
jgi:hypothetical protein